VVNGKIGIPPLFTTHYSLLTIHHTSIRTLNLPQRRLQLVELALQHAHVVLELVNSGGPIGRRCVGRLRRQRRRLLILIEADPDLVGIAPLDLGPIAFVPVRYVLNRP
jgi:hypothetical protein